jgi:hypothetical protein
MALTFSAYQNDWSHPYSLDSNATLRSAGTAISSDTNGSDYTDYAPGTIVSLLVDIDSADYTTGDEDYFIWMQRYNGTAWADIQGACIKPAMAGTSPDTIDTGLYETVFRIPNDATKIRYRVDVEGTTPSIDCAIYLAPAP